MSYTTYDLGNGTFCTTDQPFDAPFVSAWPVSDADAAEIERGAALQVVDGKLAISPVVVE